MEAVVLGIAESFGGTPAPEDAYDPKSLEHILAGTYPHEPAMVAEMDAFCAVLNRYGVTVYRPRNLPGVNQIFARDIAFVIEDLLIRSNILPDRENELAAIESVVSLIDSAKVIKPPVQVHIEGGDVMPWREFIFVGTYLGSDYPSQITARTNVHGVDFLRELFPQKTVVPFDLVKSNTDPRRNALHLDCCFQPVGQNLGIIHKEGFRRKADYHFLVDLFGLENLYHIDAQGMYDMCSNVFSISPQVVVSERGFTALNQWLRERGLTVEEVPYAEISKQEGLLRCSTLPLRRTYA